MPEIVNIMTDMTGQVSDRFGNISGIVNLKKQII